MSSRLLLMRHGAAASPPAVHDRERPLTNRGRGRSLRAGDELRSRDWVPDRIVVSSARRAQETWEAVLLGLAGESDPSGPVGSPGSAGSADLDGRVQSEPRLYDNTVDDLLDVIRESSEADRMDDETLLLIGHNPSISGLAWVLDDDEDNPVRAELEAGFPTGTVAVFDIDPPWSLLREGGAHLTDVMVGR